VPVVVVEVVDSLGLDSVVVLKPKVFFRTGWPTLEETFEATEEPFEALLFLTMGPPAGLVGLPAKGESGSEGA
jgi:hypothetical protein